MRRMGLLGGMSWESSARYYRLANEEIRTRCGGLHSAARSTASWILLGCTEIDLLVGPNDSSVPIFNTTKIHVRKAITLALE